MAIQPNQLTKYTQVRRVGGTLNQRDYPVAASQTIQPGDWLNLSSGTVQQSLSLPGSNNSVTASGSGQQFVGMALAGITTNSSAVEASTGRTTIPVAIFDAETEVLVRIYNATAGSAEPQDVNLGTSYNLSRFRGASASVWFYVMNTSTTDANVSLIEKSLESAADEDYGFVWVRPIAAARYGA